MATDTTAGETSSNNHSAEEESNASMVQSTDSIKDKSNDDSVPEVTEPSTKKNQSSDVNDSEKNTAELVPSDPMDIDVPHDDTVSEDPEAKIISKSSVSDIHNIPILDDPTDKDDSSESVEETINLDEYTSSDKSDEEDATKDPPAKTTTVSVSNNAVADRTINSKPSNVVVLNPKTNFADKQILSNDLLKAGQKVFILNGSVVSKEDAEKTKPDNINIICVSNNLNDIITNIKNDTIKTNYPVLSPDLTKKGVVLNNIEKFITTTQQNVVTTKPVTAPKFIQLTQSNYKQISPKISVTATATTPVISTVPKIIVPKPPTSSANKTNEILRSRLSENDAVSPKQNPASEPSTVIKKPNSLGVLKKDGEPESVAVAKARTEFNKCRKKLIEAAIHPQLPTYKPPVTYEGPIYSCEECDDTFSSTVSLKNHKNRRSVLFTYNCPPCNKTLEFYNRCTFLLHVRSHDAAVKACYLTISTIPSDKLNFKLLQPDEVEVEIPIATTPQNEKPLRTIERLFQPKNTEEINDPAPVVEIIENGTDIPKPTQTVEQRSASKNFDFIKSLRKNKFEAYLKNTDYQKKSAEETLAEKKSDSESSLSDDSSDDGDSTTSQDSPVKDTSSFNGSANTSQLKYFLTTNDSNSTPNTLKRPTENDPQSAEETANKKLKVTESPIIDLDNLPEPVLAKPKHTPIIIRSKTTPTKPDSTAEKTTDEITLTSSDEEEEAEEDNSTEENKSVCCRECKVEVANLSKHIRAENKPLKEFLCEHCKFFSPSKCALQAHIRMHSKTQPYICPDCGFFFNTYETFQTHVKQVCYYDFKAIRFECPECALLKPSVQAFADHLKRCHTRDVFKCSLCITSSYSTKVVEIHIKKKHTGEEGTVLEGYRCMLCPNILISKKSIGTHINKHVFSLKHLRYVYICKRCKKYASGKRSKFVQHLRECNEKKKENVAKPIENIVMTPTETAEQKTSKPTSTKTSKSNRSRLSKSPSKNDAAEMFEKDPLSIESWEADKLKAQHAPKTKICFMCRSADISSRSHSLFCNACVCSVNADDTAPESSESVKHDSGRPKRKFKCRLCKQFMNKDWATITKHYETDHQSDLNSKGETRSRQPKDKEKEKETDGKKSDNVTPVNIIKKRRHSAKDTPPAKSQKTEEKPAEPKKPEIHRPAYSSSYECFHCNMQTQSREDFKAHIVSHRDNNTQCPECGQCFMVDATLAKHLLICHQVRNLRKYFLENDLFKMEEPLERAKSLKDNQCDVCYIQCDSKQSYDKHLRTHGMAFVALQSRSKGEKPRCGLVRI